MEWLVYSVINGTDVNAKSAERREMNSMIGMDANVISVECSKIKIMYTLLQRGHAILYAMFGRTNG